MLSLGSLIGAIFGVKINLLIPESTIKVLLYLVVLFSGISILLRKDPPAGDKSRRLAKADLKKNLLYVLLGIVTGAICAASGAGGPVLVMPLLTVIGFPVHTAVGVALFDSIAIALVAASGYLMHAAGNKEMWMLLPILLIAHGIGVFFGSRNAARINQKLLKRIVAVASVLIALWKLFL